MKFTEIVKADKTSLYYIDNKRVTYERFCYKQILCNMENKKVSCSQTTKTRKGNWKHVAYYD